MSDVDENPRSVAEESSPEVVLDGVRYADLPQAGQIWRMGSVNTRWREYLPSLSSRPKEEDIRALGAQGLWLGRGETPPLAVICGGLGSAWPHMGRELYDNFPAARAGMERIAAAADWDVLALLDEPDAEKISHTRWQQPYLFLLEYAQWSQFASLGLKPALLCGHSLGEAIALCFSGIYTPEVAWYILDTRAMHMAEMEVISTRENGMMAVHAAADIIARVRETWPNLLVSNYNTPRQFIMSGPREALAEARKSLRKQRIPALLLNVNLAYHHPGMRILRDLSLRRLNALPMNAPLLKVLSCVTADFYPDDQPSICRHIAELDENPVRWTDCVHAMHDVQGISHFLELGPQDTLCGLTTDNNPLADCLPAGRKGHETEQMRLACARLYALGCLSRAAVIAARQGRASSAFQEELENTKIAEATSRQAPAADPRFAACMETLAAILAKAADCPKENIKPESDLRYDLSLRSSRFPLLIQEIERDMGVSLLFENLLGVTCAGDLARVICAANRNTEQDAAQDTGQNAEQDEQKQAQKQETAWISRSRRFVERPDISTLVFLPNVPEPSASALEGACHFSRFADPDLAAHIDRRKANTPCLPLSRAMQALVEGACLLFPDLAAHGLSDVRFFDTPLLPPGVTRECPLTVKAQAKFTHDSLMTQMCRAKLTVRDVAGNGRPTGSHAKVMSATVHMTATPYVAKALWPAADLHKIGEPGEDAFIRNFYDAAGFGAPWRLLAEYAELPGGIYRAEIRRNSQPQDSQKPSWDVDASPDRGIAQKKKSRYTEILYVVEGIAQAAFAAVAKKAAVTDAPGEILAALRSWRLHAAGFVIFNTLTPDLWGHGIELRKSWDDGTIIRFDAQAIDSQGRMTATLHHLEFFYQE